MNHIRLLTLVVALLCRTLGLAQEPSPQTLPVKNSIASTSPLTRSAPLSVRGQPTPTPLTIGALTGPVVCDDRGRIYLRPMDFTMDNPLNSPVVRISKDGTEPQRFDIRGVPALIGKEFIAPNFAVRQDGRVYYLARLSGKDADPKGRLIVAVFDNDGDYFDSSTLDLDVWPTTFAPLPNGDTLIGGVTRANTDPPDLKITQAKTPLLAIVDRRGQVVRNLASPGDNPGTKDAAAKSGPPVYESVALGPDELIYLLKHPTRPVVQVMDLTGRTTHELRLQVPDDASAYSIKVIPGRIVVAVQAPGDVDPATHKRTVKFGYAVFNSSTGEAMEFMTPTDQTKGILACVQQRELVFLTSASNPHYALVHADLP